MTQATAIYEYAMFVRGLPHARRDPQAPAADEAEMRQAAEARVEQFLKHSPECAEHRDAVLAYAVKFGA